MYEPRIPEQGVADQVVDPFEAFHTQAAGLSDGEGPPPVRRAGISRVPKLRVPGQRLLSCLLQRLWFRQASASGLPTFYGLPANASRPTASQAPLRHI